MEAVKEGKKVKWSIDALHSEIGFKVNHLVFANVRGMFREFDARISPIGKDNLGSRIDLWINAASVYTGDIKRDAHLMSVDFFDIENYQDINFSANTYENLDNDGIFELFGDLTIKNLSRRIKLDVEFIRLIKDSFGNHKAVFSVKGKINRKDWGLNWNAALEAGGVLVNDDVWINCEVQLVRQTGGYE